VSTTVHPAVIKLFFVFDWKNRRENVPARGLEHLSVMVIDDLIEGMGVGGRNQAFGDDGLRHFRFLQQVVGKNPTSRNETGQSDPG